jgi:hypothetical protein
VVKRLGATQRFWVALAASVLLHVFLFVALANRFPVFSLGSEESLRTHTHAVILTIPRKISLISDEPGNLIDPQTLAQPKTEDVKVSDMVPVANNVERQGGGQYKAIGLLTRLPQPIGEIDLNSPEITDQARQAQITLLLSLNSSGLVDDVKVVSSDGASANEPWMARIVARFRQSRFIPGEVDGLPVSTEFPVKIVVE